MWVAFAPVWRLVVAFVIGKRDQANADLLLARVAHVTDDSMPFFTSDQLPEGVQYAKEASGHQSDRYIWLYIKPDRQTLAEAVDELE